MSKNPSYNRAVRAYTLQSFANFEIDRFGRVSNGVFKRLMQLIDSLDEREQDIFLKLCGKLDTQR
jgi:hypothetical protein